MELHVEAPPPWETVGWLYDAEFPELLNSDMLEFQHEDWLICAGWRPEEDVNGEYVILTIHGCEHVGEVRRTRDIHEAARIALEMAAVVEFNSGG